MTLQDHVTEARDRFMQAGIRPHEAALDAELLARQILGWDRASFLSRRHHEAPGAFAPRYQVLVQRRARREPLPYIVGHREFWNLEFEISPEVLIPRPETELIVEEALACLAGGSNVPVIVDVGTGSGCLAVSLARELPHGRVTATDISPSALTVARRNATRHGVADRIEFVETNLLSGVAGDIDLIVANLPYVPDASTLALAPEVRDYEPRIALAGGADGLETLRALMAQAAERRFGWLIFEFGYGQEDDVRELIAAQSGLSLVRIREDLQGIPRVAIVRRRDETSAAGRASEQRPI